MKTFEHGGQIEKFAKELNCKIDEVIDLSSNINFVKPNIQIDFNKLEISSYPTYENLYERIAQNYQVNRDEIELFNGGSSAIFSLFRYLNLNYCTIFSPAYLEYKKACVNFAYEIKLINRFENIEFNIKENSLVIFVNPSTPDGKYYDLENLIKLCLETNATLLVDESFLDFCDGKSAVKYINEYDKLYILKSMTKFYSSAGIRVGTLISNEKNIQSLKRFEPAWKISQFDSNYLQEALKDKSFSTLSKALNIKNKIELENILNSCSLFEKVYESDANFILVKLKNINAKQFQESLKPFKILIRNCENFDFLDDSYVRIAVKSSKINKILKNTLDNICL